MQANILILGLGNLLLRDEGLGVRALELLQEQYQLPAEAACVDGGVLGLELLAYLEGISHLLVIDAVRTGQTPGALIRLEGDEIPQTLSLKLSMHQIRFSDILALSRLQGTVPPRVVVWGLQPALLESGVGLSETVEARLDLLVKKVVEELKQWGIAVSRKPAGDRLPNNDKTPCRPKSLSQLSS